MIRKGVLLCIYIQEYSNPNKSADGRTFSEHTLISFYTWIHFPKIALLIFIVY